MPKAETIDRVTEEISRLFHLVIREGGRLGDPPDRRMTNTQSLALSTLVEEGPLRLWALAEHMQTTDATATRTVDALEADGLVRRKAEPNDRRGVIVAATPKGVRIHAARMKRMRIVVENLLASTTEPHLVRIADFLDELNDLLTSVVEEERAAQAS